MSHGLRGRSDSDLDPSLTKGSVMECELVGEEGSWRIDPRARCRSSGREAFCQESSDPELVLKRLGQAPVGPQGCQASG